MSNLLRKQMPLIQAICKSNPTTKRKLLSTLSDNKDFYSAVSEICLNICKGNVKLSSKIKNQLKPYKSCIINFAGKTKCVQKRKKLIKQSGGFLSIVLPIIASVLTDILLKK